jgi:hypothetical protein
MSARKAVPAMPEALLRQYEAAVFGAKGAELKGASMPYTSVNGNMYSFLDKQGVMAIRLGKPEYDAFIAEFRARPYVHETGTVLTEYVAAPAALLADTSRASAWLARGLAHAKTLKPKPSRKKSA